MTPTDDELRALLALEAKATPGPWDDSSGMVRAMQERSGSGPSYTITTSRLAVAETVRGEWFSRGNENAPFIAAARNALRPICEALLEARAEIAASHKAHEETLGSARREYERGLQRCTLLTEQSLRLTAERDRYREALVLIREKMGGREGDQGWEAPEDVWGFANAALEGK